MNPRTLTFGAAILLLLTVYVAGFSTITQGRFSVNVLLQDYETDRALHAYTLTLEDMEASQRGYLLTGEAGYLSLFKQADAHLDECEHRMATNRPEMMNGLRGVIDAAKTKRDELRAPIHLVEQHRVPEAIAFARADDGFARRCKVRALTDALHAHIRQEVQVLRGRLQSRRQTLDVLLPAAGVVSLLLFAAALVGFVHHQRRGDAAYRKIKATNDELFQAFADPALILKDQRRSRGEPETGAAPPQ